MKHNFKLIFERIKTITIVFIYLYVCMDNLFVNPVLSKTLSDDVVSDNAQVVSSPSPVRALTLSQCFEKAYAQNKDLIVSRKNIEIAKAGIQIARAIPNPLAQVQIGFGPAFTELFTGQTQQVFFTEEIQTAGKRSKKIRLAEAFTKLTEDQLDALSFEVHNKVRRAYAEAAAAEAYEDLVEAQREVALKLKQIAQKRFEAGKIPKSELLQADLNVLQFDTQRNQAQGRLQQAAANLSLVLGEKPEHIEVIDVTDNALFRLSAEKSEIVPPPDKPLSTINDLLTLAFSKRPDVKTAKQQVVVNRNALTLAKAQRIPNIFIGGGFTFSTFSQHQPIGLVAQPNWLGQAGFLTVTAENPLFYQHQGEIQQALVNLVNAEKQYELLKAQAATEIVVSYNSVETTRKNIYLFQNKLLPLSAKLAKIARSGYEVGGADLTSAIVAQQQYQQTLSNYFNAVVSYQNAWADLERAVGLALSY